MSEIFYNNKQLAGGSRFIGFVHRDGRVTPFGTKHLKDAIPKESESYVLKAVGDKIQCFDPISGEVSKAYVDVPQLFAYLDKKVWRFFTLGEFHHFYPNFRLVEIDSRESS